MHDFKLIDEAFEKSFTPLQDKELESLPEERHPYHRFLYHLVKDLDVKVALEIGTWHGVGALHMVKAGAFTMAVDINTPKYASRFNFVLGDSNSKETHDRICDFVDKHGEIDLVFQDSSHHYMASKSEWVLYSLLCKEGAVWCCDDISPAFHDAAVDPPGKGMVQYFEEIPEKNKRLYAGLHGEESKIGVVLL